MQWLWLFVLIVAQFICPDHHKLHVTKRSAKTLSRDMASVQQLSLWGPHPEAPGSRDHFTPKAKAAAETLRPAAVWLA